MYHISQALWRTSVALLLLAGLALPPLVSPAKAASSAGCEGGGFAIRGLNDRREVDSDGTTTILARNLGSRFLVAGTYVEFTVVSASFGVENWTLTGAPNPLDITGNLRTAVFASKTSDHRGLTLTSDVTVELSGADIVIVRAGLGLTMKIQAKDCANGGVFQMEVERDDATTTRFTHILAEDVFYFDNPNFRAQEGNVLPFKDTTITVTPRVNFANDVSAEFVGRDSPQVATRLQEPGCVNQIATWGARVLGAPLEQEHSSARICLSCGESAGNVTTGPAAEACGPSVTVAGAGNGPGAAADSLPPSQPEKLF